MQQSLYLLFIFLHFKNRFHTPQAHIRLHTLVHTIKHRPSRHRPFTQHTHLTAPSHTCSLGRTGCQEKTRLITWTHNPSIIRPHLDYLWDWPIPPAPLLVPSTSRLIVRPDGLEKIWEENVMMVVDFIFLKSFCAVRERKNGIGFK